MPRVRKGDVVWVEPQLVAEVEFSEWTHDGRLRHPSYQGLRDDKPARRGAPRAAGRGRRPQGPARAASSRTSTRCSGPTRASRRATCSTTTAQVAPVLVPHLRGPAVHDAPLSRRHRRQGVLPEGRAVAHARLDPDVPRARLDARARGRRSGGSTFPLVNDELALLWMVNMGCIDMNPWYSRVDRPDRPDFVLFDLDPTPEVPWPQTVEVALLVQEAARRARARVVPEDVGRQGLPRARAARPALDLRRHARVRRARRRRDRARASEARDDGVVEGAPSRRADRREPERRGQDDRVGLLGAPAARARRSRRRCAGTRSTPELDPAAFTMAACSSGSSGTATCSPAC